MRVDKKNCTCRRVCCVVIHYVLKSDTLPENLRENIKKSEIDRILCLSTSIEPVHVVTFLDHRFVSARIFQTNQYLELRKVSASALA